MSDTSDKKQAEVQFSQEQYELLKKCFEKGDMTEWNEWRRGHKTTPVLLEGAELADTSLCDVDLADADLQGAKLNHALLFNANFQGANLKGACMTGTRLDQACFLSANLQDVTLETASLRGAILRGANLTTSNLTNAKLQGSHLQEADLRCVDLVGANLVDSFLNDALLQQANLSSARLEDADLTGANMQRAHLNNAKMRGAFFSNACMESAHLHQADLRESTFLGANLQNTNFSFADLRGADLKKTDMRRAVLSYSSLRGAILEGADLHCADLRAADLCGAKLSSATLTGTRCGFAIVDGKTLIKDCTIDDETDFTGVGLASARIDPGLRVRLEGNIRKKRWQTWCRADRCRRPVELFWMLSDYGRSTWRLIAWFAAFAALFALVYWMWGYCDLARGGNAADPGIISRLFVVDNYQVPAGLTLVRSVYFSLVTMTTLGFGDMHANPGSYWGHILLSLQVLIGYVLLAAMVTRLAVLFTGLGPESGKKLSDGEQKNGASEDPCRSPGTRGLRSGEVAGPASVTAVQERTSPVQ